MVDVKISEDRNARVVVLSHVTGDVRITIQAGAPQITEYMERRLREIFAAPKKKDHVKEIVDRMVNNRTDDMLRGLGL